MSQFSKFAAVVLAVGLAASAFARPAPPAVMESFGSNTDLTGWGQYGNHANGQNYAWSNTDFTGTAVNPPGGTATGAGELGGTFKRAAEGTTSPPAANANFYAWPTGTFAPGSTELHAKGVYVETQLGGSSGLLIGFFKDETSWNMKENASPGPGYHNDDPANFIGLYMIDGNQPRAELFDIGGFEDRTGVLTTIPVGTVVPWSIDWDPNLGNKGRLSVMVGGFSDFVDFSGDWDPDSIQHFGVLSAGHDGGSDVAYVDDLMFSSTHAIPEPASLGLIGLGGLFVARRRGR